MIDISPLRIALQFLTTLPIKASNEGFSKEQIGSSLLYYPLVGLLIGSLVSLLAYVLNTQMPNVAAVLVLTTWVALTGGLHLDGLADSADAWLGGLGDKAKTLAIMKDPTSGPIAVSVLVLILLIKFTMLSALLSTGDYLTIIISIVLARSAIPLLFLTTPYIRQNGLGSTLSQYQPKTASKQILVITAILVLFFTGLLQLFIAILSFIVLRHIMIRRLNGTNGDTAGAMIELLETILLITAVIL